MNCRYYRSTAHIRRQSFSEWQRLCEVPFCSRRLQISECITRTMVFRLFLSFMGWNRLLFSLLMFLQYIFLDPWFAPLSRRKALLFYFTGKVITANYVPVASYSQLFPDSVIAREPILSAVKLPTAAVTGVSYWRDIHLSLFRKGFLFMVDVDITLFIFSICFCLSYIDIFDILTIWKFFACKIVITMKLNHYSIPLLDVFHNSSYGLIVSGYLFFRF